MLNDLHLYDVTVGNHHTQMRLSEADAASMGGDAVRATEKHPAPPAVTTPVDTKSRLVTSNKMRGTDAPVHHTETENHHHG